MNLDLLKNQRPVFSDDQIFVAKDDLLETNVNGVTVLCDFAEGSYFELNETAALIWQKIAAGLTLGVVLRQIGADFAADPAAIRADVIEQLHAFAADGLIRRGGATSAP